jgi:hypothetical protein
MYKEEELEAVERFVKLIQTAMADYSDIIPNDVELMVHASWDEDEDNMGQPECYYYLVHPQKRTLFWLNSFDAAKYLIEFEGVDEPSHMSERKP